MRNFGVEQAMRVARYAAERPHPYVVGFSMAGDEANFPAGDFAEPFALAAASGLGCSVHAGEWDGPESVRAALGLPVTRIAHGVRAIEDPAVVEELAARGIVLECCPTSNVVLGLYPSYEEHPLSVLAESGVAVTLGSDDPALVRRLDRRRVPGVRGAHRLGRRGPPRGHENRAKSRILRGKAQDRPNEGPHSKPVG